MLSFKEKINLVKFCTGVFNGLIVFRTIQITSDFQNKWTVLLFMSINSIQTCTYYFFQLKPFYCFIYQAKSKLCKFSEIKKNTVRHIFSADR